MGPKNNVHYKEVSAIKCEEFVISVSPSVPEKNFCYREVFAIKDGPYKEVSL